MIIDISLHKIQWRMSIVLLQNNKYGVDRSSGVCDWSRAFRRWIVINLLHCISDSQRSCEQHLNRPLNDIIEQTSFIVVDNIQAGTMCCRNRELSSHVHYLIHSIPPLPIYHVDHRLPTCERLQVTFEYGAGSLHVRSAQSTDVRRQDHVGQIPQWVVFRKRFRI